MGGADGGYCVALDGVALEPAQCARIAAEQALQLLLLAVCAHRVLHLSALHTPIQAAGVQWLFSLHVLLVAFAIALSAASLVIAIFQQPRQFTSALLVTSGLDAVSWWFFVCVLCLEHTRVRGRQSPPVVLLVTFSAIYDALAMLYDDRRALWTRSTTLAQLAITRAAIVAATALLGALRYARLRASHAQSTAANCELKAKLLAPGSDSDRARPASSAFDRAGFASRLSYAWLSPLIALGVTRRLDMCDVPELPVRDATAAAVCAFRAALDHELRESPQNPSLLRVARRLYGAQVLLFAAWSTANKALGLASPLLLKLFLDWADARAPSLARGYVLAAAMVAQALLAAVSGTQYALAWQRFDLRVRAGVVSAIYDRALALSSSARRRDGALGRITNLVSVDVGRLIGIPGTVFDMVLIPGEIAVALLLLSREVSYAFVAGVAVLGTMLPIQTLLGGQIQRVTKRMLAHRDERVAATAEALRAIKPLKLLAWIDVFIARIARVRRREVAQLAVRKYLDAACVFFWAATPVLVQTSVFAAVIYSGHDLTAANAFTAVALLDRLIYPMNYFPWIINGFLEARVSALRIRAFVFETDVFAAPQLLPLARVTTAASRTTAAAATTEASVLTPGADSNKCVVEISDCIFTWRVSGDNSGEGEGVDSADEHSASTPLMLSSETASTAVPASAFELCIEQLVLRPGGDYVACGPVGAGKSSLLLALLGEMRRQSGHLRVARRRAAYAPQTPWLFQGSVRQNITMCDDSGDNANDAVDEPLYRHVLRVCELEPDLRRKPQFDRTPVGENGSNLSGGQRLRVSLARALYQRTALYLLDDPLSGLDPRTAARIVVNCLGSAHARAALFPPNAAVVLVTHSIQLIEYIAGDPHVLVLAGGHVLEHGAFSVLSAPDASSKLRVMLHDASAQQQQSTTTADGSEGDENSANVTQDTDANASNASQAPSDRDAATVDVKEEEEHREAGAVHLRVWRAYASAVGTPLIAALALAVVVMQLSRNGLDWWIAVYTNAHDVSPLAFAHTLLVIAGVNCIAVLARSFLFAHGGLRAARRVYLQLATRVFGASLAFFDATPIGRVLNRLSGDTYAVDESLPFLLNILIKDVADVIGALVVLLYANAFVLLLLVPLSIAYVRLQRQYRPTARHLRRLDAVTQSPLLSLVTDSLAGLVVIRALQLQPVYSARYTQRLHCSQRMAFASANASAWFGIRLDLLGVCVTSFAAVFAVAAFQATGRVSPGILGLTLTYALPIVSKLNAALGSFVATEQQMIAVERVHEYAQLPSEEHVVSGGCESAPVASPMAVAPTSAWPQRGEIEFRNLSVAYPAQASGSSTGSNSTVMALRGVSCCIGAGEKVGVCGRTGAGKSTFLNALFRAVVWTTGGIAVDGVALETLPLRELRARLTYIPQDVVVFAGSIRSNLDPEARHADHALWAALTKCGLDRAVAALARGLESVVEPDDVTLSKGQSQLLGVARALLRPSKVLCIDEATASVDFDTEQLVAKTLETEFADSTIVIVAHRIKTVMGCDRVLVLDDGRLVEAGKPHELARDPSSMFSRLASSNSSETELL